MLGIVLVGSSTVVSCVVRVSSSVVQVTLCDVQFSGV